MGKYDDLAKRIIESVGGKENINALTHCATKLRFKLEDESRADTRRLKTMPGVITAMQSSGQYQIVIGNHVADVCQAVMEQAGIDWQEEDRDRSKGYFGRIVDLISGIFAPALSVLCAVGVLKGFHSLFLFLGLYGENSSIYQLLQTISGSFFYFLPIFIGYTAAKRFQMNQFTGMAIGACLVYPGLVHMMNYSYSIIPMIFAVWGASYIERFLKKVLPGTLKLFLVPLVTLLITVPLTYLVTETVLMGLSTIVVKAAEWINTVSPILTGSFICGFWPVLIILGIRETLTITVMAFPEMEFIPVVAVLAQTGAVLAVLIKTRNKRLRSISLASGISSVFGVMEPGIYGVTLPKKTPFFLSCVGAAVGGAAAGYLSLYHILDGSGILRRLGWTDYANKITSDTNTLCNVVIAAVISFAFTFLMTLLTDREPEGETMQFPLFAASLEGKKIIHSPLNGKLVPLSEIGDEVFSSGVLGDGIAIEPYEGIVYAPADCRVTTFFPTGHAIGLTTTEGIELLIHIGMDTVQLNGKYFKPLVKQEENLRLGQPILEFDMKGIRKEGYGLTTPVIMTNKAARKRMDSTTVQEITVGDALLWTE